MREYLNDINEVGWVEEDFKKKAQITKENIDIFDYIK